ncbi:MAG: glycosyltransferase family 2 protein [Actinomycetota bacterium]
MPSADSPYRKASTGRPATALDLDVVIVNFDSGDHLRVCLEHIDAAGKGLNLDVVVFDNASTDGSADGAEDVDDRIRVMRSRVNVGYGAACNRGVGATTAPFVCLLNPDIVPEPGSLTDMVHALARRAHIGVLGPRLVNPDGSVYPSCRVVPGLTVAVGHALFGIFSENNPFTRAYKLLDINRDREQEVDWVSGAAMFVRREAFLQVDGFDEGFFMYVEDLDLCARMKLRGWKVVYYPGAQMLHHVAGSSRRAPYKMIRHHHFSLIRYATLRLKGPMKVLVPVVVPALLARMLVAWAEFYLRQGRDARQRRAVS